MNLLLGSIRGAPGVTTLAVAMAYLWPEHRRSVLVEADPTGGTLALRYNTLSNNPSLLTMLVGLNRKFDAELVWKSCQRLPGDIPAVVAGGKGETIVNLRNEMPLEELRQQMPDTDFLIDMGRVEASNCDPKLLMASDIFLIAVKPFFEQLEPLLEHAPTFASSAYLGVVVVGDGSYEVSEINDALNSQCGTNARVVAEIPYDKEGALAIAQRGVDSRQARKSPILSSISRLNRSLWADRVAEAV